MSKEDERGFEEEVVSYEDFRVGTTFGEVYDSLRHEADRVFETEGRRMYITRHTILGRFHQIKRESYNAYLRDFSQESDERDNDLPF